MKKSILILLVGVVISAPASAATVIALHPKPVTVMTARQMAYHKAAIVVMARMRRAGPAYARGMCDYLHIQKLAEQISEPPAPPEKPGLMKMSGSGAITVGDTDFSHSATIKCKPVDAP